MMRANFFGAAAAAFLLTAGTATAGGMYEDEGSLKDAPAPVAPVAIWSGLYIGGTVGFGAGDTSDRIDIETEDAAAVDEVLEFADDVFPGLVDLLDLDDLDDEEAISVVESIFGSDYDMNGAVYGGFLGYNWQAGNAVFGIEAGLNGTDFDGHTECMVVAECERELDYYGTVTGRLGYAMNNVLFYGFGGFAWGDVSTDVRVAGVPVDDLFGETTSFSNEETHTGWTAGVGLELALTERFIAGVEYAHVDLGEERHNIFSDPADGIEVYNEVDMEFDVVKVRASYKLWDRREPLEAYK